tara:strand:+ start:357 stop:950 length:594 start_codon:yes stop_codon:yes gene_type:complete
MRNIGLRKEMMCQIKDAIHEEIDHNTIKRLEFYSWKKLDKHHKEMKFEGNGLPRFKGLYTEDLAKELLHSIRISFRDPSSWMKKYKLDPFQVVEDVQMWEIVRHDRYITPMVGINMCLSLMEMYTDLIVWQILKYMDGEQWHLPQFNNKQRSIRDVYEDHVWEKNLSVECIKEIPDMLMDMIKVERESKVKLKLWEQ